MKTIRLLLLRLLISWWFIPMVWLFFYPLAYLLTGESHGRLCRDMTHDFWYGLED